MRAAVPTRTAHPLPTLLTLLALTTASSACGDDAAVSGADSIILDGGPDGGLDFGFDVPDDLQDGDSNLDANPDSGPDAALDSDDDLAPDADDDTADVSIADAVTDAEPGDVDPDLADDTGGLDTPEVTPDLAPDAPPLPCEGLCDPNATCEAVDDVTEICVCNPGYDGDGFDCTLRAPPWLVVTPTTIDFGIVGVGTSNFETLTLENIGPEPRRLGTVRLQQLPSQGFAIFAPFPFPLTIAPETAVEVEVRFRPTVLTNAGGTTYANTVVVDSDDPVAPAQSVPVTGVAVATVERCLTFDETTVDFGIVDPGETERQQVTLRNCGPTPLALDTLELTGETEGLTIEFEGGLPTPLDPNATLDVVIVYAPESPIPVQGLLVARSTDGTEAAVLVHGGYACPTAAFDVEGGQLDFGLQNRIVGRVGDEWRFDGGASDDPSGGDLLFTWTLQSPPESTDPSVDPDLESEGFTMVPDVAGRYNISLVVTSDESGLTSCNIARHIADAFPLHAEVEVEVTWTNSADVDLHLVQSNEAGEFGPFGTTVDVQPLDAYYANLFAEFGARGPADNAWHQGDDIDGFGPETIELGALDPRFDYRVGVNYARRLGTISVTPTLTIRIDDVSVGAYTTTLTNLGFWIPAVIGGDGSISD